MPVLFNKVLAVSYTHLDVYKRQEMSTNFGDRIYRVSMQLVTMKDVVNEARILENVDADINLVAMFFYDETELQEYIQTVSYTHLDVYKRQDQKGTGEAGIAESEGFDLLY